MSGCSREACAARCARAHVLMARAGLDALLMTTEADIRYFTGFRTPFWQSPTRPWFVVLPVDRGPLAVIPDIGRATMAAGYTAEIRSWSSPDPTDDGVSLLCEALAGFRRVGLPRGAGSHLRMPLADFDRLRAMTAVEWCDSLPLIRELRMVKSEDEIGTIATICSVASRAFGRVPELAEPGMSMTELARAFRIALLSGGAEEVPYLVGGAGAPSCGDVISPPDDTPLASGDVITMDTGATLAGYYCDFNRNFALGTPDARAAAAAGVLWRATGAALELARPGVRACDLHAAMARVIDDDGTAIGRMGHGLGLELTEWPSLTPWDTTVLREGMVLTLEPAVRVAEGCLLVSEENIVIAQGPPRLLSRRAPPGLIPCT